MPHSTQREREREGEGEREREGVSDTKRGNSDVKSVRGRERRGTKKNGEETVFDLFCKNKPDLVKSPIARHT